jgi:hypothetical protein
MESFDTVTEALTALQLKGYTLDFNISYDKLACTQQEIYLHPDEFEITAIYRFEGATNPADEDIVYAVESKDGRLKGTITDAFGLYADGVSADMVKKLSVHLHS